MGRIIFYGLLGAVLAAGVAGCKDKKVQEEMNMEDHKTMNHEETGKQTAGAAQQGELVMRKARKDEIGKPVVCPVMGTKFNVKANTDAADYKGKSYYFCCEACPSEFKKNPGKYIK